MRLSSFLRAFNHTGFQVLSLPSLQIPSINIPKEEKENMVDSLISIAREKLSTILQNEVALLLGVTDEIEKLFEIFTSIQAVLEDAESRRVKDRAVKIWLEKLKDVAYDVDDVLDEWTTEDLRSQAAKEGDGSCFSFLAICFLSPLTCFNHLIFRHRIGSRIKEARGRLDDIAKETIQLGLSVSSGLRERVDTELRQHENKKRETSSQLDRLSIVGRKGDKNRVLDLLLRESSQEVTEVPFVISIVGMGGLGKTSLAKLVYNDDKLKGHFDVKMWVCVSDDFDVKQITKLMIESAIGSCNLEGLDRLQIRLREILHSKRFLLVLDDVWNEDSKMWDELRLPFQAGALGSRIIITTRSENVAKAMGNIHMHKLEALSREDCWLLFSRSALLKHRNAEDRLGLEEIGRKIVKKCGGVPLAAKTIGSAMQSTTRRQWELVLESETWNLNDVLEGILPALLLSYYELPPPLKQCLAYCSVFPKDWTMVKDMVVKLWVAQGFIGSNTGRDMEEIGGLYFDDLLRRSLLQDAKMDGNGNIISCKMHDLVHDLAQSVAGNDCSIVGMTQQAKLNLNKVRHSLIMTSDGLDVTEIPSPLYKARKLRTLLVCQKFQDLFFVPSKLKMSLMKQVRISFCLHNLFHHSQCLRTLDMTGVKIMKLPRTVGQLKHLRYLDLSYSSIEELSAGLINCINLQTLILNDCLWLRKLPKGMKKLINLRHIELDGTIFLEYLPKGIGRLSDLQTLTKFIVGGNHGCELGELKHLNLLRGRLEITGLQKVLSQDEARQAELYKKTHLHTLNLFYEYVNQVEGDEEKRRAEDVLQGLQPHTNLKKLRIEGYRGNKFPEWMGDPSSNLIRVELYHCEECEELPALWNLPKLQELRISRCPLLAERYKVGGQDRHKIAQISRVVIYP